MERSQEDRLLLNSDSDVDSEDSGVDSICKAGDESEEYDFRVTGTGSKGLLSMGRRDICAVFAASLSNFAVGCIFGWSSVALRHLGHLDVDQLSWVVSLSDLGALAASLPAGIVADVWGRRLTLLSSLAPLIASWILVGFDTSFAYVAAGRFLAGVAVGIIFTVNTLYWSECSPPSFRGSASALSQASMSLGVLLMYCAGPYIPYGAIAGLGFGGALLFGVAFFSMPESPYYLLMKQRHHEAATSLRKLRGRTDVNEELEELSSEARVSAEVGYCEWGIVALFSSRVMRRALLLSTVLGALQRMAGLSAVIAYSSSTLPPSFSGLSADQYVMMTGAVLLLGSVAPLVLMDRLGRRPLLFISCAAIFVSMLLSGIYYNIRGPDASKNVPGWDWMPAICIMVYALGYVIGMGPVSDTVPGEVFPTQLRGRGVSAVSCGLTAFTFLVSKMFLIVSESFGVEYMHWFFALVSAVTALFAFFFLPETRGKSLEQVQELLDSRRTFMFRDRNEGVTTAMVS